MKKPISIIWRVLGVLVLLAIVGGAFFRFGYSRGVVDSPAIAEQMQAWQNEAGNAPAPYAFHGYDSPMLRGGYPFSPYMMHGRLGFNSFGHILGILFVVFLFFGAMRFLFFGCRMHSDRSWYGHMPPWRQQPAQQSPAQPEASQEEDK